MLQALWVFGKHSLSAHCSVDACLIWPVLFFHHHRSPLSLIFQPLDFAECQHIVLLIFTLNLASFKVTPDGPVTGVRSVSMSTRGHDMKPTQSFHAALGEHPVLTQWLSWSLMFLLEGMPFGDIDWGWTLGATIVAAFVRRADLFTMLLRTNP